MDAGNEDKFENDDFSGFSSGDIDADFLADEYAPKDANNETIEPIQKVARNEENKSLLNFGSSLQIGDESPFSILPQTQQLQKPVKNDAKVNNGPIDLKSFLQTPVGSIVDSDEKSNVTGSRLLVRKTIDKAQDKPKPKTNIFPIPLNESSSLNFDFSSSQVSIKNNNNASNSSGNIINNTAKVSQFTLPGIPVLSNDQNNNLPPLSDKNNLNSKPQTNVKTIKVTSGNNASTVVSPTLSINQNSTSNSNVQKPNEEAKSANIAVPAQNKIEGNSIKVSIKPRWANKQQSDLQKKQSQQNQQVSQQISPPQQPVKPLPQSSVQTQVQQIPQQQQQQQQQKPIQNQSPQQQEQDQQKMPIQQNQPQIQNQQPPQQAQIQQKQQQQIQQAQSNQQTQQQMQIQPNQQAQQTQQQTSIQQQASVQQQQQVNHQVQIPQNQQYAQNQVQIKTPPQPVQNNQPPQQQQQSQTQQHQIQNPQTQPNQQQVHNPQNQQNQIIQQQPPIQAQQNQQQQQQPQNPNQSQPPIPSQQIPHDQQQHQSQNQPQPSNPSQQPPQQTSIPQYQIPMQPQPFQSNISPTQNYVQLQPQQPTTTLIQSTQPSNQIILPPQPPLYSFQSLQSQPPPFNPLTERVNFSISTALDSSFSSIRRSIASELTSVLRSTNSARSSGSFSTNSLNFDVDNFINGLNNDIVNALSFAAPSNTQNQLQSQNQPFGVPFLNLGGFNQPDSSFGSVNFNMNLNLNLNGETIRNDGYQTMLHSFQKEPMLLRPLARGITSAIDQEIKPLSELMKDSMHERSKIRAENVSILQNLLNQVESMRVTCKNFGDEIIRELEREELMVAARRDMETSNCNKNANRLREMKLQYIEFETKARQQELELRKNSELFDRLKQQIIFFIEKSNRKSPFNEKNGRIRRDDQIRSPGSTSSYEFEQILDEINDIENEIQNGGCGQICGEFESLSKCFQNDKNNMREELLNLDYFNQQLLSISKFNSRNSNPNNSAFIYNQNRKQVPSQYNQNFNSNSNLYPNSNMNTSKQSHVYMNSGNNQTNFQNKMADANKRINSFRKQRDDLMQSNLA